MDENSTFHASDLHMLGTHLLRDDAELLLSAGFDYEMIQNQQSKAWKISFS